MPGTTRPASRKDVAARDLNYDRKRLQAAHDDGSHGTRTACSYALAPMADTPHELGFKGLRATGLKRDRSPCLHRRQAAAIIAC